MDVCFYFLVSGDNLLDLSQEGINVEGIRSSILYLSLSLDFQDIISLISVSMPFLQPTQVLVILLSEE